MAKFSKCRVWGKVQRKVSFLEIFEFPYDTEVERSYHAKNWLGSFFLFHRTPTSHRRTDGHMAIAYTALA